MQRGGGGGDDGKSARKRISYGTERGEREREEEDAERKESVANLPTGRRFFFSEESKMLSVFFLAWPKTYQHCQGLS